MRDLLELIKRLERPEAGVRQFRRCGQRLQVPPGPNTAR